MAAVPDVARVPALQLIRGTFDCTAEEAKSKLANLPLILKRRLSPYQIEEWQQKHANSYLTIEYPIVDTEPNAEYGPLKKDRLLGAPGPVFGDGAINLDELSVNQPLADDDTINLAIQCCSSCSCVGTLIDDFKIDRPCPNCGERALKEESSWIT